MNDRQPRTLSRPQARQVKCPECGAEPGRMCVGRHGKLRKANHQGRVLRAYVRADS